MIEKLKYKVLCVFVLTVAGMLTATGLPVYSQYNGGKPVITSEDTLRSLRALSNDIKKTLGDGDLKKADFGVVVYSLDNRKILFARNENKQLTPASLTKLFTSFAAVVSLGPDFYVRTGVYTDSTVKNGVVEGNLYIVGTGDCMLAAADIEQIARQIASAGVKEVKGSIYADGSFFDDETSRYKYSGDQDVVEPVPPITALSIEKNTLTVLVNPGARDNFPVDVKLIPESDFYIKEVRARTGGVPQRKSKGSSYVQPPVNRDSEWLYRYGDYPVLAQNDQDGKQSLSVNVEALKDNARKISVSGNIRVGETYKKTFDIENPELVIAGCLRYYLTQQGVKAEGATGVRKLPAAFSKTAALGECKRPLSDILSVMNKESDNYYAETVFKIIGANYGKYSNTARSARERIAFVLDSMGIPVNECKLNDGSGLSRRNVVTAGAIIKLLQAATGLKASSKFESLLSVAGVDGTLKSRFDKTLAENNLKAKTGTLRNVSGLAGYVYTLDGEKLAFALLFNGSSVGYYKKAENKIGKILSQFFYFNNIE